MRLLLALSLSFAACGPALAGSEIPATSISARIAEAIAGRIPTAGRYHVTLADQQFRLALPDAAQNRWQLAALTFDPSRQTFEGTLGYTNADGATDYVPVTGTALSVIDVPALNRDIAAGEVVTRADLTTLEFPADRMSSSLLTTTDTILGLAARRPLRAMSPVYVHDVTRPIAIKKGDTVTVTFAMPGISLTSQGQALNNAANGEPVSVMNAQSRRTVEARVTGPGMASVGSPTPTRVADQN
jgi:flagella basal body P-ring formation protein FlgA